MKSHVLKDKIKKSVVTANCKVRQEVQIQTWSNEVIDSIGMKHVVKSSKYSNTRYIMVHTIDSDFMQGH